MPSPSAPRCRRTSPTVSPGWRTSAPTPSTCSWTNGTAPRRTDGRDARERAGRVPRVRLVAVAERPAGLEGPVGRTGGGELRRLGGALSGRRRQAARLDPVRPGAALPAFGGASRGAAVRRLGARDVRLRRLQLDSVGGAVALPRRDRRGARPGRQGARGVCLPLPRG